MSRDGGALALEALQSIWERRRAEVEDRVRRIGDVALALMEDRLDSGLLEEGITAAHKLVGTLGTFGFTDGSVLAEEVEALLRAGNPFPDTAAAVRLSELVLALDRVLEGEPSVAEFADTVPAVQQDIAPDVYGTAQRRIGVDVRIPDAIRSVLAADGLEMVEVDVDDAGGASGATPDPSTAVEVLILHVEHDSAAEYDRCRAVRARSADPAFPILLAIPRHDTEAIRRVFSSGADDFVVWPVVGPELLARVNGHLDRLRLRSGLPFASDERRHAPDPIAGRHVDVVIVDDDTALADLLEHTLAVHGYTVERFSDGADAVDALIGAPPVLSSRAVLLDVGLPGLNGMAVLRRLGREGILRRTRVLMLTSHAMESDVLSALQLGAFDHVSKPFSMPVLMHRLQRALMS